MGEVSDAIEIRPGGVADVATVLALLDGASGWLVAQGRAGQWGTEPQSTNPHRIAMVTAYARDGGLHLAYLDHRPVGALMVGAAPAHIPRVDVPELYVKLLVTDRSYAGHGIGRRLLAHARQIAARQGAGLLRLDCYAGDDRALVRYYEREGFTATDTFTVDRPGGPWPGQVLQRRLPDR